MFKILIKDTTREEREKIVLDALEGSDVDCGNGDGYAFYLPYIEGEKELRELTMEYNAKYASSEMMNRASNKTGGCSSY